MFISLVAAAKIGSAGSCSGQRLWQGNWRLAANPPQPKRSNLAVQVTASSLTRTGSAEIHGGVVVLSDTKLGNSRSAGFHQVLMLLAAVCSFPWTWSRSCTATQSSFRGPTAAFSRAKMGKPSKRVYFDSRRGGPICVDIYTQQDL